MKKNGFTLVELLAVLIVLAIISVIAVPVISDAIESGKRDSFEVGINHLMTALQDDQATYNFVARSYTFPLSMSSDLKIDGDTSHWKGTASIDENGRIEIHIHSGKYCATKESTAATVTILETSESACLN